MGETVLAVYLPHIRTGHIICSMLPSIRDWVSLSHLTPMNWGSRAIQIPRPSLAWAIASQGACQPASLSQSSKHEWFWFTPCPCFPQNGKPTYLNLQTHPCLKWLMVIKQGKNFNPTPVWIKQNHQSITQQTAFNSFLAPLKGDHSESAILKWN